MVVALVLLRTRDGEGPRGRHRGEPPAGGARARDARGALLGDIQGDRLVDDDRDGVPDALRAPVGVRV